MFLIDLLWLGVIAQPIYDEALGPLKRQQVYWPAAIAFYVMYIGAIVIHAVVPATSVKDGARRGAGLGFVAYATYELTNWAVIANWPSGLVGIDIIWGVILTGAVGAASRLALEKSTPKTEQSPDEA